MPYHQGRPAAPEALMRARYCAYALAKVDFIIRTTHPAGPHFREDRSAWKRELQEYCRTHDFVGLSVIREEHDASGGRAWVSFEAQLQDRERRVTLAERSLFERDGVRWKYVADDPATTSSTDRR